MSVKPKTSEVSPSAFEAFAKSRSILSPKEDFVFKFVFGDQNNLGPVTGILQAILPWLPKDEFESVTFLDTQRKRSHQDDKLCVLDICIRLTSGRMVNIEIQLHPMPGILNRMQYYNAKMMIEQIKKGHQYKDMGQVVAIFLLDYKEFEDDAYHHEYRLVCRQTGHELPGSQEIHVLEFPKLPPENDESPLWKWLRLLSAKTEKEMRILSKGDQAMTQAVARIKEASASEQIRHQAFRRHLAKKDQEARLQGSRDEGLAEGLAKGKAEGLAEGEAKSQVEFARRLLRREMPLAEVAELSGLPEAEVKRLAAGKNSKGSVIE